MSDIFDVYGKDVGKVIDQILKRQLPASAQLRTALKKGVIQVIDGHTEEKKLFLRYLDRLETDAIKELHAVEESGVGGATLASAKKAARDASAKADRFSDSFERETPLSWGDVETFKNYFQDVLYKGQEFHIGHKDAGVATLNWELVSRYSARLDSPEKRNLFSKLQALSAKVDKLTSEELAIIDSAGSEKEKIDLLVKLAAGDQELSVKLAKDAIAGLEHSHGMRISVEIELAVNNTKKGALTKALQGKVKKLVTNYTNTVAKELTSQLQDLDIANVRFSPSYTNDIERQLASAFLGKKFKKKRQKAHRIITKKIASSNQIKSKAKQITRKKKEIEKKVSRFKAYKRVPKNFSTIRVLALINEVLAKSVRDLMGDSTDPAILLRNQTGRFSESARLLTLTRSSANILVGTYTYQRNPYDTFLPGGRLHTQRRDPRIYVEGAIREAAISILKDKFPGLQMELV